MSSHRPEQRRRRIVRRVSAGRRRRGDAQHHVGERRVRLSRRRPGRDAADGSAGPRGGCGRRRASGLSRSRRVRPARAARVAARSRGHGALPDRRARGDRGVRGRPARRTSRRTARSTTWRPATARLADAIARAVRCLRSRSLVLFGLPGSELLAAGDGGRASRRLRRICRSRVRARRLACAADGARLGHSRRRGGGPRARCGW